MLHLRLARHIVKQYEEKGTIHLPDFHIYDFEEYEYQAFWREITSYPRQRLYTDGVDVFRVSWFRTVFESFKGWLGFENHCHPNRVEMTLAKIAYAGYIKGFKSSELNKSKEGFPISMHFIGLVNLKRTNQTSKILQRLLMSYFVTHSHAYPEFYESIRESYSFGRSLIQENLAYLIPSIDPQDSSTIQDALAQIKYNRQSISKANCFKSSTFAEAYAQVLVFHQQYDEALEWSPEIKQKFKVPFIEFYLTQQDSNPLWLESAVDLIAALFLSPNTADQKAAVDYIKTNLNYEEQASYLMQYPKLRTQVAQGYLEDAKNQTRKWRITKLLTGNLTFEYLAQAVRLDPQVLEQDHSMQDVMMREEWTLYQFDRAIDGRRFQDADTLYTSNPDLKFNNIKLERLREYYLNQFDIAASQIAEMLLSQTTGSTVQTAEEQIALAKKIVSIKPQDSLVLETTMNYASTVLAVDKLVHLVNECDRTQLSKAQLRLDEYRLLNNNIALMQIYNKLLLRKIDCLITRLAVPFDYNDSLDTRSDFVNEHTNEIEDLKKELKTFISLNEPKSKEMRKTLAKMYYLLADTLVYFEEKKQESIPYFSKAHELMPENLYYSLRYHELIEDEKRHGIRKKISALGHLHGLHYQNYMLERWADVKIMSNGFDIHAVLPNDSFLHTLGKAVGFF